VECAGVISTWTVWADDDDKVTRTTHAKTKLGPIKRRPMKNTALLFKAKLLGIDSVAFHA
jgi:hypothetical protein